MLLLAGQGQASTTVSSNPLNGAMNVSPTAPVVFTFSGAVQTNVTIAFFYSTSPPGSYPVTSAWNSSSNVLACTPMLAFPASTTISWQVSGVDANNLSVLGMGTFTTGAGSGSTGSGTNAVTTFGVIKVYWWDQYSAASPVTDTNVPYYFAGTTTLASNRTAAYISLTSPTSPATNLTQNPIAAESYFFMGTSMSSNAFETAFPQGTYTFYVSATASNQTVPVVLPAGLAQSNPPHITNFVAAQSVSATQAFTLGWDAFAGGTTTDFVVVAIGGNAWKTPDFGAAGALNGTATSVTIPANSLQANSNYTGCFIGFYRGVVISNATYVTTAFRASAIWFNLNTISSTAARPVVTNAVRSGSSFSFDILTTAGQSLVVASTTNCALPLAQWQTFTTNSPGTRVHFIDSRSANTNRVMVYRVRNGT
jgi:hypothetical protein